MSHSAIIEAAARALQKEPLLYDYPDECSEIARAVLAALTPLISANALETAAKVVETKQFSHYSGIPYIAAAIRAMKERPGE